MVDVAQITEPVQRWFVRQRTPSETESASRVPEGVRIRRRKDAHVAACARLLGIVSHEGRHLVPQLLARREWLTADDIVAAWVAEEDGTVQGHVAISRVDVDPVEALRWREVTSRSATELAGISRFFVRPTARRRGIGTALLETAVAECRAQGFVPVAQVVSTNRSGVPLLDRAGWRMVGMYPCGRRGEDLETYMYVAPPASARP